MGIKGPRVQDVCAEMPVWVCDSSSYGFASAVYNPSVFYDCVVDVSQDFVVPVLFSSLSSLCHFTLFFLCPALTGPTCSLLTSVSCCTCTRCAQLLPFPCTPFVLTLCFLPRSFCIYLHVLDWHRGFDPGVSYWPFIYLSIAQILLRPQCLHLLLAQCLTWGEPQPVGLSLSTDETRWDCQVQSNTKSAWGNANPTHKKKSLLPCSLSNHTSLLFDFRLFSHSQQLLVRSQASLSLCSVGNFCLLSLWDLCLCLRVAHDNPKIHGSRKAKQ